MDLQLTITKTFNAQYLAVEAGPRYWEDSTVNGVEDTNGDLMPCRDGDYWKPIIELETGKIINWEIGKTADVHYKVCDNGIYRVLDENKEEITSTDGYVLDCLSPEENGYGDYIIMKVDKNGIIQSWKADLSEFQEDD